MNDAKQGGMQHTKGRLREVLKKKWKNKVMQSKGGRYIGLTTLLPSCVDCLEIWEGSSSCNSQGLSRPVMGIALTLLFHSIQLTDMKA